MQVNTEDKTSTSGYQEDVRVRTQDNTHEIVSKVAYLIGVPQEYFGTEAHAFRADIYRTLDAAKNARLLRNRNSRASIRYRSTYPSERWIS